MKKLILFFLTIVFFSLSSFAQVKSDYAKNINFSKYKTYSFAGWQKNSGKVLNDMDKERIYNDFKAELAARGMRFVESGGDAIFTLYVVVEKKTSLSSYTDFTGGVGLTPGWGWGMGAGWAGGVGMGTASTTYSQQDYKQGTLVTDMYNAQTKKMIWQGVIVAIAKSKSKQRDRQFQKLIQRVMSKFPVQPLK